ncbi:MAG: hypothetical protein ABIW76_06120 [Fibrobacteria bacterium]
MKKFRAIGDHLVNLSLIRQDAAPSEMSTGFLYHLKGGKLWEDRDENGRLVLPSGLLNNLVYLQFN